MTEKLPPTLQNILDQKSLKWIFCGTYAGLARETAQVLTLNLRTGGKGGVGEYPQPHIVVAYHQLPGGQARRPRPAHSPSNSHNIASPSSSS